MNCKGYATVPEEEPVADLDTPAVTHFLSLKVLFLESGWGVSEPQVAPVRVWVRTVSNRKQG